MSPLLAGLIACLLIGLPLATGIGAAGQGYAYLLCILPALAVDWLWGGWTCVILWTVTGHRFCGLASLSGWRWAVKKWQWESVQHQTKTVSTHRGNQLLQPESRCQQWHHRFSRFR